MVCRDFTETTYRGGQSFTRTGTACREVGTAIGGSTEHRGGSGSRHRALFARMQT